MNDFKVSIIIPVFNEENTILPILERINEVPFDKEIIIVDVVLQTVRNLLFANGKAIAT